MKWALALLLYIPVIAEATDSLSCMGNPSSNPIRAFQQISEQRSCALWTSISGINLFSGRLSENWAMEAVGADLAKQKFMRDIKIPVGFISIADTDDDGHGAAVRSVLTGKEPYSMLPEAGRGAELFEVKKPHSTFPQLPDVDKIVVMPRYISNSSIWTDEIRNRILRYAERGAYVFTSAGNNWAAKSPMPVDSPKTAAAITHRVFIVGSVSPFGAISDFSKHSAGVTVTAPSDRALTVNMGSGPNTFQGTSGATPIVTATAATFELISGYHPSREELEQVLVSTVIPFPYGVKEKHGAGLVNTFKVAAVAERLKSQCQGETACVAKALKEKDIFNFAKNSGLQEKIKRDFPNCSGVRPKVDPKNSSCESQRVTFEQLRTEAFLHPESKELWRVLSCIHESAGLTVNALFFARLASDQAKAFELRAVLVHDKELVKKAGPMLSSISLIPSELPKP